jgi:CTP:molybdopterin cytidylyltransferase MocA
LGESVASELLAAGAGSRLGGRPKCLLELGGVPLIRSASIWALPMRSSPAMVSGSPPAFRATG